MKKLVKLVLVVLAVVALVGLFAKEDNASVTLDFENSGSITWFGEDDDILSADYEGEYVSNIKNIEFTKYSGFKNSGLPETIKLESISIYNL